MGVAIPSCPLSGSILWRPVASMSRNNVRSRQVRGRLSSAIHEVASQSGSDRSREQDTKGVTAAEDTPFEESGATQAA